MRAAVQQRAASTGESESAGGLGRAPALAASPPDSGPAGLSRQYSDMIPGRFAISLIFMYIYKLASKGRSAAHTESE